MAFNRLSNEQKTKIRQFQAHRFRRLQHIVYRIMFGANLKFLAKVNGSDKWGSHWYAQHYERLFSNIRKQRLNVLEIGIGGYDDPKAGGSSLRMWRTYFPNSNIYGIDIFDKSAHNEKRIKTFKGSQVDTEFLGQVIDNIGNIDIIIDDGSHLNEHVIKTFSFLFPHLNENGIYVIEDTQTSYWPYMGGSSEDLNRKDTTMGFLKSLIDGLNHVENINSEFIPSYYDKNIVGLHFFHNIVFINKGKNNEKSNLLTANCN